MAFKYKHYCILYITVVALLYLTIPLKRNHQPHITHPIPTDTNITNTHPTSLLDPELGQIDHKSVMTESDSIDTYKKLSANNSGIDLATRQKSFIKDVSPTLSADEAVRLFLDLKYSSSDSIVEYGAYELGPRVFGSGIEAGLQILSGVDFSPDLKLLIAEATRSFGQDANQNLSKIISRQGMSNDIKEALITGTIENIARTSGLGIETIDLTFNCLDNGMLDIPSARRIISDAQAASDFEYIFNESKAIGDNDLLSSVITKWASFHPEACLKAFPNDQDIELLKHNAYDLISGWCTLSSENAAQWATAQQNADIKDESMKALVQYWTASGHPNKAWNFVAQVADPEKRSNAANQVFEIWEKQDKAAAVNAWQNLFHP